MFRLAGNDLLSRGCRVGLVLLCAVLFALGGCYVTRPSHGGGQTSFRPPRIFNPADVAMPAGYRIELVTRGLTFPTGVTFDDAGTPYVIEAGYAYGEAWTTSRLLRVGPDGVLTPVAAGEDNGPWTGVVFYKGAFYVADFGVMLEHGRQSQPFGGTGALWRIMQRSLASSGDAVHFNVASPWRLRMLLGGIGT